MLRYVERKLIVGRDLLLPGDGEPGPGGDPCLQHHLVVLFELQLVPRTPEE